MIFIYLSEAAINIVRAASVITAGINLLQQTQSLIVFALAMSFEVISSLLSPLFLGKIIDRYNPVGVYKTLMLALFAIIVVLFFSSSVLSETLSVFFVYASISFFAPLQRLAQQSYFAIMRSTTHLRHINSRHQMAVQSGQVIGISLAAYVVDHLPFHTIHTLFIVFLLAGCVFAYHLHCTSVDHKKNHNHSLIRIIQSLSYPVRWLLVVSTFDYLIISLLSLTLPLLASAYLKPGTMMSVFDLCYAISALSLSYAAVKLKQMKNSLSLCLLAYTLLPLAVGALVWSPSFWVTMLAVSVIGGAITLSTIGFNSYIQTIIPKHIIGRVLAIRRVSLAILLLIVINSLSWVQSLNAPAYYALLIILVAMMGVMVIYMISVVLLSIKMT